MVPWSCVRQCHPRTYQAVNSGLDFAGLEMLLCIVVVPAVRKVGAYPAGTTAQQAASSA